MAGNAVSCTHLSQFKPWDRIDLAQMWNGGRGANNVMSVRVAKIRLKGLKMRVRFVALTALAVLALAACSEQKTSKPQEPKLDPVAEDGRAIAEAQCGRCHATGPSGGSPNPKSPPFRVILSRYKENVLSEELREGIRIGHPDMPEIQLEPQGVDALIAYLKSIQVKGGQ
jgi:mono/diheme cytochrome c family protein